MSQATLPKIDELYRCRDLLVRKVGQHGSACCVVTFDSFTDVRALDRPGFGEGFLHHNGIDAIHVIPRENDWYHYPEMADAMECVKAATRGYDRVLTYGSSMGAYAAIRFAGLAGAHAVLALSPQFSIHPDAAPWEHRWLACGRSFEPRWEKALPFPAVAEACVVHDPLTLDARHVAALEARFRFTSVDIPNAGHPVTGCLAEIGLLQVLVLAMCRGRLDPSDFLGQVQARLPSSPQYLTRLAGHLPRRHRGRRLTLLRQAVAMAPEDPWPCRCLAVELRRNRKFDESLAWHRRTLELRAGHPGFLTDYSVTLEASGDVPGALAVLEDLVARTGGAATYRVLRDDMRRRAALRSASLLRRLRAWVGARTAAN